jgi:hypothetical protein
VTNKVKIGFDLDGVLIPDHSIVPNINEEEFFNLTLYEKPLFNPVGAFDIVTARVEAIRPVTEKWLSQLTTKPENVFMRADKSTETPAEFKYRICKQQGYLVYVESDLQICKDMLQLTTKSGFNLKIIHYATWVENSFTHGFDDIDDWK